MRVEIEIQIAKLEGWGMQLWKDWGGGEEGLWKDGGISGKNSLGGSRKMVS